MFLKNLYNCIKNKKNIFFRFAPEPSGYLHLGHIKSIYINYILSKKNNNKFILRFDDTNPNTSKKKFVYKIIDDLKWLNINIYKITYASDYFDLLYKFALILIKNKLAYIDFNYKNKLKWKNNSIKKNLYYFNKMKLGFYNQNECVLRAKINNNINKKNFFLKNPVMYRIIYKKHFKTKNKWNIYPTYDWAHGQCDLIEKISYSLCSQEFEHHKLLYNWFLKKIIKYYYKKKKNIPIQYEYSKLNINYNILSKRKIKYLIKKKKIKSWKDHRLLTIISLKNKGYSKNILFKFIKQIGFSKRNVNINLSLLNNLYKKSIDIKCLIVMVIDEPLKIIINNNKIKYINYKINKHKIKKIFYKKKLYINKYDFIFFKKKNIYKLSFDKNIRLKQIGIIKILKIKYNFLKNKINKIYCKIIKYKNKIKIITIQWVSNFNKYKIYINYIKKLFIIKNINNIKKKYKYINKNSLIKKIAFININIKKYNNKFYQFQRIGYFYLYNKKKKKFNSIFFLKNYNNFKKK